MHGNARMDRLHLPPSLVRPGASITNKQTANKHACQFNSNALVLNTPEGDMGCNCVLSRTSRPREGSSSSKRRNG